MTTRELDHFQKEGPLPPGPNNHEHQEWINGVNEFWVDCFWLSTRTRPDLDFAVSLTAQVLTRDLQLLKF